MSYSEQTEQMEQIREYQDMVVTLRQDFSVAYKGLLMKECQVVSNNLADAKFNIPRQNLEVLQSLYRVDLEGTRLRKAPTETRQLLNHAQLLRKCVHNKRN